MKGLLIICALLCACLANAQLVVGNDQSGTATIWLIDVNTGVATPLFASSTADAKPWGMAADEANRILYWNAGSVLKSATYDSLLSGSPTINSISMTYNGSGVNFVGMGFNPATGKLLGTRNISTEAVYEIDPATGIATLIWAYSTSFDFGGLEYDAATGKLYGLSDTAPTGSVRGLYEINTATMTTTFIAPYPAGETDIDALAVADGKAYYVTDGPNTTQVNFYIFEIASGTQVGTLPSPFTGSGTFAAATWAPGLMEEEPGPGDVNGDGCVDDADLAAIVFEFGGPESGSFGNTDQNDDGIVDDADLSEVIFNFGNGC
jgi:hypothetical protein